MASYVLATDVRVDAFLVGHEILHNLEPHQHGSIVDQFPFDFIVVHGDGDRAWLAVILVVGRSAAI